MQENSPSIVKQSYVIGLGSNVGNRLRYCQNAIAALSTILPDLTASPHLESEALLLPDAPAEWNMPFINMAVSGHSSLNPQEMLYELQRIENAIGRQKIGVWAPREIDLDILVWGGGIVADDNLKIPHPELLNRSFAMRPLADLWPDWRYPCAGKYYLKTAEEICTELGY